MADSRHAEHSWWRTLPGVLTGVAGILGAVTGLLVVLHEIGVFDSDEKQNVSLAEEAVSKGESKNEKISESGSSESIVGIWQTSSTCRNFCGGNLKISMPDGLVAEKIYDGSGPRERCSSKAGETKTYSDVRFTDGLLKYTDGTQIYEIRVTNNEKMVGSVTKDGLNLCSYSLHRQI